MAAKKHRKTKPTLSPSSDQANKSFSFSDSGIQNLFAVLATGLAIHLAGWYLEFNQWLQTGFLVITSCAIFAAGMQCGEGRTESIIVNVTHGLLTQYACYYFELRQTIHVLNALNTCFTIYLAVNKSPKDVKERTA